MAGDASFFAPGWALRGLELAQAIAERDPAFAERFRESVMKTRERQRAITGLTRPHVSQREALMRHANVVLGRDLRRHG